MGPIPGLSWADVVAIAASVLMAMFVYGTQWFQADVLKVGRRGRTAWRVVLLVLAVPFVLATLNRLWFVPPEPVRVGSLVVWLGGTALVRLGTAASAARSGTAQESRSPSDGPIPNTLRMAREPNVVATTPVSAPADDAVTGPSPGPRRWLSGLLTIVLLAGVTTAPGAVSAALTQTPCEQVEMLIASSRPEGRQAAPEAWLPVRISPEHRLTVDRSVTLEDVALERKNPEQSRTELHRDGFVAGYDRSWDSANEHVEFSAQEFATSAGALDFHAFANRYACQFANEAFRGSHDAIGLQIRFASGKPIGEQLSWVSGTTRIIVFVDHDASPPDHSRVESLVDLIGQD